MKIGRPGYIGKYRERRHKEWNEEYGKENWRLVWEVGETFVGFLGVCTLYEDAYYKFLQDNPDILEQLTTEAVNVYDDEPSNIESGFDYLKQETPRTHIQDIAIRRVLIRMGLCFQGKKLIRIRQEKGMHPLSVILSPGKVPFHRSNLIREPEIKGWWDSGTVESFYQSNRFLQAKLAAEKNEIKYYPNTIEAITNIIKKNFPKAKPRQGITDLPSHLLWMSEEIKKMNNTSGKAGRWIGYVLARLETMELLTNQESRNLIKKDVLNGYE